MLHNIYINCEYILTIDVYIQFYEILTQQILLLYWLTDIYI